MTRVKIEWLFKWRLHFLKKKNLYFGNHNQRYEAWNDSNVRLKHEGKYWGSKNRELTAVKQKSCWLQTSHSLIFFSAAGRRSYLLLLADSGEVSRCRAEAAEAMLSVCSAGIGKASMEGTNPRCSCSVCAISGMSCVMAVEAEEMTSGERALVGEVRGGSRGESRGCGLSRARAPMGGDKAWRWRARVCQKEFEVDGRRLQGERLTCRFSNPGSRTADTPLGLLEGAEKPKPLPPSSPLLGLWLTSSPALQRQNQRRNQSCKHWFLTFFYCTLMWSNHILVLYCLRIMDVLMDVVIVWINGK